MSIAPSLFPKLAPPAGLQKQGSIRPFGLTTALPMHEEADRELVKGLSLCPVRQITVTADGEPFIHAPSMKSKIKTVTQTVEDMQLSTDNEDDSD